MLIDHTLGIYLTEAATDLTGMACQPESSRRLLNCLVKLDRHLDTHCEKNHRGTEHQEGTPT